MIPDEAIDAALTAFSDEIAKVGVLHKDALRAALEAAAPHMLGGALEDAASELDGKRLLHKPFHEYYPEWLRKRANEMRAK